MKIIIPEIKSTWQRFTFSLSAILILSTLSVLSFIRNPSYLPKDFYHFASIYFKEVFPVQIMLVVAWYVVGIKPFDSRRNEYFFLSSLPLTPKHIFTRLFVNDLLRFLWVPVINSLLLLVLVPASSINYIAPLALFLFISFIFCCILIHWLHLWIPGTKASQNYLEKYNPIPLSFILVFFSTGNLLFLLWNNEFNVLIFCLITLVFLVLSVFLFQAAAEKFKKLDLQDYWLKQIERKDRKRTGIRNGVILKINQIFSRLKFNPLLYKNWQQTRMMSTSKLNNLLILIFVSLAYLISQNNEYVNDMFSVLQGIMLIFYAIYSYTVLNKLHSTIESPAIIHSLPIRKADFYFSVFLPPFVTLMLINLLIAGWLLCTTQTLAASLDFWFSSGVGIILWLTTAVNCGISQYPDVNLAKRKLLYWYSVYLIFGAVFFKYLWLVLLILFVSTFIQLKNVKLFGPCYISKKRNLFL